MTYYERHREEVLAKQKQYYQDHIDKFREYNRRYYYVNRRKLLNKLKRKRIERKRQKIRDAKLLIKLEKIKNVNVKRPNIRKVIHRSVVIKKRVEEPKKAKSKVTKAVKVPTEEQTRYIIDRQKQKKYNSKVTNAIIKRNERKGIKAHDMVYKEPEFKVCLY